MMVAEIWSQYGPVIDLDTYLAEPIFEEEEEELPEGAYLVERTTEYIISPRIVEGLTRRLLKDLKEYNDPKGQAEALRFLNGQIFAALCDDLCLDAQEVRLRILRQWRERL